MTDRLEQLLVTVPDAIDWPEPSPHLAGRIVAAIEQPGQRVASRRWIWATVTAVIVALALIPATRQAVADLVVEAGVRIGVLEGNPTTGADLDLGEQISIDAVGIDIRVPTELGDPAAVFADGDTVSMVWVGTETLPAASDTDVGVLLSQSPAGEVRASKGIGPETVVQQVEFSGTPALWIEGADHTFTLYDQNGEPIQESTRLAANVLLWTDAGIDYRLELSGDLDDALGIARSMEGR